MNENDPTETDPDLEAIGPGHVCKHGIRWPHECRPCADAAWEKHKRTLKLSEDDMRDHALNAGKTMTVADPAQPLPAIVMEAIEHGIPVIVLNTVKDN